MDSETLEAVAVVDIDPGQATEWFDMVEAAHAASNGDWDSFSDHLRSTAGGSFATAVETFLWYADDHGRIELIDKLVADPAVLPSAYASSREQAAEQPADGRWDTVVREFGPGWAGWDGSEEGWAQFRDWTYSSANAQDPELYATAYEKLAPLDELPAADRIARLTELGFTVQAQAVQPDETPAEPAAAPGEPSADPIIEEALAEALAEVPGAEDLTPEELTRMRAEIAAELASDDAK
jgi:hypothetical protein